MSERVTHAKVKFFDDKSIKIVPITKIQEFQVKVPENVNDFTKNSFLYNCLWTDEKNPEEVALPVQICELAVIECEQDLQNFENKRGNFKPLDDTVINEYYATNTGSNSKEDILQEKKQRKANVQKVAIANINLQKQILQDKRETLKACDNLKIRTQPKIQLNTIENSFPLTSTTVNSSNEPVEVDHKNDEKYEFLLKKLNKLENDYMSMKNKYLEANEKLEIYKCLNEKLQFDLFKSQTQLQEQKQLVKSLREESEKNKSATANRTFQMSLDQDNRYADFQQVHFNSSTPKKDTSKQLNKKVEKKQIPGETETKRLAPVAEDKELEQGNNSYDFAHNFHGGDYSTPTKTLYTESPNSSTVIKETSKSDSDNEKEKSFKVKKRKRLNFDDDDSIDDIAENVTSSKKQKCKEANENQNYSYESENLDKDIDCVNKKSKQKELSKNTKKDEACKEIDSASKKSKQKEQSQNVKQDEVCEEIFSNFKEKKKEEHEGEMKSMIYLNKDFKIPYDNWRKYFKMSASLFTKKLFREMYPYPEEVARRCVVESDKNKTPKGRNKRKQISPIKSKTLERCLRYFHSKRDEVKGKKLEILVAKKNHYLTEDINKAIQQLKTAN